MLDILTNFFSFLEPEYLIKTGGFYLLLFIVFAETGLFFGFFLPGDYLLFLAGLFTATKLLEEPIYVVCLGLVIAAIAGNFVGYWFGYRTGPMLFKRKDTWFFKKRYIVMADGFYKKYGGIALLLGRFMPIIRTFAPIFAGVVKLDLRKFIFFNILGAVLWVLILVLLGYFLGLKYPEIIHYIEYIVIAFIALATAPVIYAVLKKKLLVNQNNNK